MNSFKITELDNVTLEGNGRSGCSDFVRKTLKTIPKGNAVLLSEMVADWAKESKQDKKAVGAQVRQTAGRIGKLTTRMTNVGKRTFVIHKEEKKAS